MQKKYLILILSFLVFVIGALIYPYRAWSGHSRGIFLQNFSAFSHSFFFVMLWSYPYLSRKTVIIGGVIITALITPFELLQKEEIRNHFDTFLPQTVLDYGRYGTFDARDLVAGLMGAIFAVLVCLAIIKKEGIRNESLDTNHYTR